MLCNWLGYASAHRQVGLFQEKRSTAVKFRGIGKVDAVKLITLIVRRLSPHRHVDLGLDLVRLFSTKVASEA